MRTDADERHVRLRGLVARVVLAAGVIRIEVSRAALRQAIVSASSAMGTSDPPLGAAAPKNGSIETFALTVPAKIRVRGNELRFIIDGPSGERPPEPDSSLIRVVVQGHDWFQRLLSGNARSLRDIAMAEGVTDRYVRRLIDLAFLAPTIASAILDGTQPVDLTAEKITNLLPLPESWVEQRRVLGFD